MWSVEPIPEDAKTDLRTSGAAALVSNNADFPPAPKERVRILQEGALWFLVREEADPKTVEERQKWQNLNFCKASSSQQAPTF